MVERQEIHCHECGKYVQFDIDVSLNGNHVLNCPNCDHEHCRVVENGRITDIRWDSRNGPTYQIGSATLSNVSIMMAAGTSSSTTTHYIVAQSWLNTMSTTN